MDKIKFLGTAGARFVVTHQLRKSGGIWLSLDNTNILVDPGPGSLVRVLSSKPRLNPTELDGIILTHRHIDHSNDINIMIEAMTDGGFKKKGVVFAPSDAIDEDSVILNHFRNLPEKIEKLYEKGDYKIGNIGFSTPIRHRHGVETYGLNIFGKKSSVSIISDTQYFDGLEKYYTGDVLILNVVLLENKPGIQHISIKDAEYIISRNKPKLSVLTHFGWNLLTKSKPWELAESLSKKIGVKIIAASDGMEIDLNKYH
ncbi:MAG: MBL fold metallo-hydrolase [Candidatus Thermoplasmatota archaeon]|nr:MBL fold metallo-hydrolase [Candidatus Thermoplasmatota archaeon]